MASALSLTLTTPTIISLNCTGREESVTNCTLSTSGVCSTTTNAALRCLGMGIVALSSVIE